MDRITIRPRAGLSVPMHDGTGYLPATGVEVERSLYWQRRLDDSDVEITSAAVAEPAKRKGAEA